MDLHVYIDGGARGNPGPAAAGVVIHAGNPSQPLHEGGYFLGHATNNTAEYQALVLALGIAGDLNGKTISVHSDSQLLVQQMSGKYQVKSPTIRPLYTQAQQLLKRFSAWRITHVRREFNRRADELANRAMDARGDVIVVGTSRSQPTGPSTAGYVTGNPSAAAVPRFFARFMSDPGPVCPAACDTSQPYAFGPQTPAGCCVFAAAAVLGRWLDTEDPAILHGQQVHCSRCGVAIRVASAPNRSR